MDMQEGERKPTAPSQCSQIVHKKVLDKRLKVWYNKGVKRETEWTTATPCT